MTTLRAVIAMYWLLIGWPGPIELGPFPEYADCEQLRELTFESDGTCELHLSEWPER